MGQGVSTGERREEVGKRCRNHRERKQEEEAKVCMEGEEGGGRAGRGGVNKSLCTGRRNKQKELVS